MGKVFVRCSSGVNAAVIFRLCVMIANRQKIQFSTLAAHNLFCNIKTVMGTGGSKYYWCIIIYILTLLVFNTIDGSKQAIRWEAEC